MGTGPPKLWKNAKRSTIARDGVRDPHLVSGGSWLWHECSGRSAGSARPRRPFAIARRGTLTPCAARSNSFNLSREILLKPRTIIVTATLAGEPWAGPAWDVMQVAAGFKRLGHKVYYFEVAQNWPFDPVRATNVTDSIYALPYLKRLLACFGLEDSFAYRRS